MPVYKNFNKILLSPLLFFAFIAFLVAIFSPETYICAFGEKTWWECVEIGMKNFNEHMFNGLISELEASKNTP